MVLATHTAEVTQADGGIPPGAARGAQGPLTCCVRVRSAAGAVWARAVFHRAVAQRIDRPFRGDAGRDRCVWLTGQTTTLPPVEPPRSSIPVRTRRRYLDAAEPRFTCRTPGSRAWRCGRHGAGGGGSPRAGSGGAVCEARSARSRKAGVFYGVVAARTAAPGSPSCLDSRWPVGWRVSSVWRRLHRQIQRRARRRAVVNSQLSDLAYAAAAGFCRPGAPAPPAAVGWATVFDVGDPVQDTASGCFRGRRQRRLP